MADVTYTVTGREQRNGRDTAIITMTSSVQRAVQFTGKGNYDPASHLVIAVHCEIRQTTDAQRSTSHRCGAEPVDVCRVDRSSCWSGCSEVVRSRPAARLASLQMSRLRARSASHYA